MGKTHKFLAGSGSISARKKFQIWASETCISSILEQKLELFWTEHMSLNFSFFIQSDNTKILYVLRIISSCQ